MTGTTIDELKKNRLAAITAEDRAVFEETYEATRLALDVGEKGPRRTRGRWPQPARASRPDGHQPSRSGTPRSRWCWRHTHNPPEDGRSPRPEGYRRAVRSELTGQSALTDILIPDVPEDLVAIFDLKAQRLGLSRSDYLRRVRDHERIAQSGEVSTADLADFTATFATSMIPRSCAAPGDGRELIARLAVLDPGLSLTSRPRCWTSRRNSLIYAKSSQTPSSASVPPGPCLR
jgi:hypothetical protein